MDGFVGESKAGWLDESLLGSEGYVLSHLWWTWDSCVLGEKGVVLCYSVVCALLVIPVIWVEPLDFAMQGSTKGEGVKLVPLMVDRALLPAFVVVCMLYDQSSAVGGCVTGKDFFSSKVCARQGVKDMSDGGGLLAAEKEKSVELSDVPVALWLDMGICARVYGDWEFWGIEDQIDVGSLDSWRPNVCIECVGSAEM